MTTLDKEIITEHEAQLDLIECGAVHSAHLLINEAHAFAEDEALTIERVRLLAAKLGTLLDIYDSAVKSLEYYKKDAEKEKPNA